MGWDPGWRGCTCHRAITLLLTESDSRVLKNRLSIVRAPLISHLATFLGAQHRPAPRGIKDQRGGDPLYPAPRLVDSVGSVDSIGPFLAVASKSA